MINVAQVFLLGSVIPKEASHAILKGLIETSCHCVLPPTHTHTNPARALAEEELDKF